jgi:hypothetical protein
MLDLTNSETAGALKEADAYLRSCKGFGTFGCGPDKRHMYAALLVMCTYASVTMAEQMDSDGPLAANAVVASSALASVTMFGWIFLFKCLGMF